LQGQRGVVSKVKVYERVKIYQAKCPPILQSSKCVVDSMRKSYKNFSISRLFSGKLRKLSQLSWEGGGLTMTAAAVQLKSQ
jgi:hypothetical protein